MARHAATDGSFGRSATGAAARGGVLLVIAVVLGIVLLHSGSGDPYTRSLRATGSVRTPVPSLPVATTVTVALRAPAEVKVLPANGTGASGAAGRTGDKLKAAGYNVLAATNTTKQPVSSSAVYFKPGLEREARVVATLLALPDSTVQPLPTPAPVPDPKDADVLVVVGPDLAGKSAAPAPTPTTARRTTATTARPAVTAARTATTAAHTATTKKP